jgi:hypothetical protein
MRVREKLSDVAEVVIDQGVYAVPTLRRLSAADDLVECERVEIEPIDAPLQWVTVAGCQHHHAVVPRQRVEHLRSASVDGHGEYVVAVGERSDDLSSDV